LRNGSTLHKQVKGSLLAGGRRVARCSVVQSYLRGESFKGKLLNPYQIHKWITKQRMATINLKKRSNGFLNSL